MRLSPIPAQALLPALLLLTALLKGYYVFALTDYSAYVVSDPAHYFHRAMALYQGQPPSRADWEVFPMGSTVLLALFWKLLALLHLPFQPLPAALCLNIAASTATVAIVWRLAQRLLATPSWVLAVTLAYGLFYPLVYLNALTLSEAPAQLFFMLSVLALVEVWQRPDAGRWWLPLAGLAWALALLCRPSFALAGPAALAVLALHPPMHGRLKALAAFLAPAVLLLLAASLALWMASSGASYKPAGSNGGLNFFMQQCHVHGAQTHHDGYNWIFVPPLTADQPELGIFETNVPFSQQGFFFAAGWHCLREQPGAVARLLAYAPSMLYGNFFPSWHSAAGFTTAMPLSRHLSGLLLLLTPLGYLALRRQQRPALRLLALNGALLVLTFSLFNADHRHLYALSFIYFLLGFAGLRRLLCSGWRQRLVYLGLAAGFALLLRLLIGPGGPLWLRKVAPITVAASQVQTPVADGSAWNALETLRFQDVVHIQFDGLRHEGTLHLSLDNNDAYALAFFNGSQLLGTQQIEPLRALGMRSHRIAVPAAAIAAGYTRLSLRPLSGDGRYSVAGLRLE